MSRMPRLVYEDERLRALAMPLGGIGCGSVAICGDGGLRQWQIFNNICHDAHVPHSFFAVRVQTDGDPVARVLMSNARYDDVFRLDGTTIEPMVAWGINPGQAIGVSGRLPRVGDARPEERETLRKAYEHTGFEENRPMMGLAVDVAFVGSCTNGRISDLREAAKVLKGKKVSPKVKALAVPGSRSVARQAEAEGLAEVFRAAGFEWRDAGCSMCLAMNPDKLVDRQVCASSSNRNFIGRQGSPKGRTLLMSPAMVAAAAVAGEVVDIRAQGVL